MYERGDIIMRSKPFAFIIITKYREEVCEACWEKIGDGKEKCQGCGYVYFCSKKCQESVIEKHNPECKVLQNCDEKKLRKVPEQLRLVLRIWLIKQNSDENELSESYNGYTRTYEEMMDHAEDLKGNSLKYVDSHYSLFKDVFTGVDLPDIEEFISIYGKIITNSFSLRTDRLINPEAFGTGVYLMPSIIDHSCTPNCTVVFRGTELLIVATQTVPDGKIQEVAKISYVNIMEDTAWRQLQQRAIWYFECDCDLCKNKSLDEEKHSLACEHCSKPVPVNIQTLQKPGNCRACKKPVTSQHFIKYKNLHESVLKLNSRVENLIKKHGENGVTGEVCAEESISYNETAEWCVGEMEDVFSLRDITYIQLLHYVFTVCCTNERWSAGVAYGERALSSLEFYYGEKAGLLASLNMRLGICHGELGNTEMSSLYLDKADDIYRLVPGEKHPFYSQDFQTIYNAYEKCDQDSN